MMSESSLITMTVKGWTGQEARRARLRDRIRQGYAELHSHEPHEAVAIWLRAWRELAEPGLAHVDTLAELGEAVGLAGIIAPWFDNLVEVGRWIDPRRAPETFAVFEQLLHRFEGRFAREPWPRTMTVRATSADLLRAVGDHRGAERGYAELARCWPRSARPVLALTDSLLDFGGGRDDLRHDLERCVKLLNNALQRNCEDAEELGLRHHLEAAQMDLERVARFGDKSWIAMPNFEVWAWPAPAALFELDPDLYDEFHERWVEFFVV